MTYEPSYQETVGWDAFVQALFESECQEDRLSDLSLYDQPQHYPGICFFLLQVNQYKSLQKVQKNCAFFSPINELPVPSAV